MSSNAATTRAHIRDATIAPLPLQKTQQGWRWWLSLLARANPSNWEHVTVNKNVDSITMPKWVAIAILGAVLAFGVQQWFSRQAEHDTLIEIRTELRLAKEHQAEKDSLINGKLNDLDAWKDVMNGNMKEIKGMLTQQQIDAVGRPIRNGQQ